MSRNGRLSQRDLKAEMMDDPCLDRRSHARALRGLQRINSWSRSVQTVWGPIHRLAVGNRDGSPVKILDIATGGGDVPIGLMSRAGKAGLPLKIEGCDKSPVALEYAKTQAEGCKTTVKFFVLDVLQEEIPAAYDVVMCSLFLHHLTEEQAVELLKKMKGAGKSLVLIQDLLRSRPGWLLACAGTRLLATSPVVHYDGPQSVRAAFSLEEVESLAREAGYKNYTLQRRWPFRYLLTLEKS